MKKDRADKILVERGLAETRQKAQALIMAGLVSSDGRRVEKAGRPLAPDAPLSVEKPLPYVGRGGLKLEQALNEFAVDPTGLVCADVGSSTGGFTDCLLQRGAARAGDPLPLLLCLIKPQFEAGKGQVGKKGVIRDTELHAEILTRITGEAAALGFAPGGLVRCATRGQKGNQEFFARFRPGLMEPPGEDMIRWIREAVRNETD